MRAKWLSCSQPGKAWTIAIRPSSLMPRDRTASAQTRCPAHTRASAPTSASTLMSTSKPGSFMYTSTPDGSSTSQHVRICQQRDGTPRSSNRTTTRRRQAGAILGVGLGRRTTRGAAPGATGDLDSLESSIRLLAAASPRHDATRNPLDRPVASAVRGGAGWRAPPAEGKARGSFREAGFLLLALLTANDSTRRRRPMCKLCDEGIPQIHSSSRRDFLRATAATGIAAAGLDARGRIVMPGFIDTHHHQFETALRSFLADG